MGRPNIGADPVVAVKESTDAMHAKTAQVLEVAVKNVQVRAEQDACALNEQRAKFAARNREMEAQLAADEARLADLAEATSVAVRIEQEEASFQQQIEEDIRRRGEEQQRVATARMAAESEKVVKEERIIAANQGADLDKMEMDRKHDGLMAEHEANTRKMAEDKHRREVDIHVSY